MAIADAGLDPALLRGPRASVVLGTTMGEADVLGDLDHAWIHKGAGGVRRAMIPKYGSTLLPIHVARAIGSEGAVLTLPAACAAGNYAIGFAADLIRSGKADVVVTGAAEMLQELQYSGFVRLAAMAPAKCQPFDLNRQGLILGEGAGILVLEEYEKAKARGAKIYAEVVGYGSSADASHITAPAENGEGAQRAFRQALKQAKLNPTDVDYINAHGTSTVFNDKSESDAIKGVFGDHAKKLMISSTKSMTGHLLGGAGGVEGVISVLALSRGILPPTINYKEADPECDRLRAQHLARGEGRRRAVELVWLRRHQRCAAVQARLSKLPTALTAVTGSSRHGRCRWV